MTSHDTGLKVNPDYPEELQPRQRERAASELQVNRIANRLNPARLGENPMISDGAPVVGPDGVVETGNGRTIAIKKVYEQGTDKAKLYRDWLIDNADRFGIDAKSIESAKEPVLVRVRQTEVDRVTFTQEGNVSTVAEMSAVEIASGETGTGKGKAGKTTGGTQKAVGPAPKLKTAPPSQSIPLTRRRDIVKFLSDKLDIPIRVGRYRQRARGIFKVRPEVVRTKLAQDIPTIAHEVGHYLDKKFGLSATKSFDGELMALGQVTSKPSYSKQMVRAEGVAEFMRLYLTDSQDAIKQAPHYYAAFEQIMAANRDIHDVLLQARQDITNWISQPAKARVLGVLSVGEKSGGR